MEFKKLQILPSEMLSDFKKCIDFDLSHYLEKTQAIEISVDYFDFYKSVSSVYSSKIEGENIDFDSFFKYKFLKINYKADYTKRAEDLFQAYGFIENQKLSWQNLKQAHSILSRNMLPKNQQGVVRNNPMFVINRDDRIEYVAATPSILQDQLTKLFEDIEYLFTVRLGIEEAFYFAAFSHLVFVKIHPFQDGNGRAARLLEKWFLLEMLGKNATAIQLEKNYYLHLSDYYENIRRIGLDYENLDYSKGLKFLLMTALGLKEQVN